MKKLIAVFLVVILFQSVFISCKNMENTEKVDLITDTDDEYIVNDYKTAEETESTEPLKLSILYSNTDYGFDAGLPASWEGYSIIETTWSGQYYLKPDLGYSGETASGPKILIRHPLWTEESPWEDIPIEIFTPEQWEQVINDDLITSAAPIPPMELDRNSKYVFALPPRYNFDYSTGWEEVQNIITSKSIKATENIK